MVIHRLPRMIEESGGLSSGLCNYNLAFPPSSCPACKKGIRWYDNIPVASYLLLKGRCRDCKSKVPLRYPLVELAGGIIALVSAATFGFTITAFATMFLWWSLLALFLIDVDTMLLPDAITLPLLWAGLLYSAFGGGPVPLKSALLGAVIGYMTLWLIYWAFLLARKKEGMGRGDFKLLAALGAWLGAGAIPNVLVVSGVIGLAWFAFGRLVDRVGHDSAIPFGPSIIIAGMIVKMLQNY